MTERLTGKNRNFGTSATPAGYKTAIFHPMRWLVATPLIALPIMFGGARPWLWAPTAGLFLLGGAGIMWTEAKVSFRSRSPGLMTAVLLLPLCFPLLQTLPLPTAWLSFLSPARWDWLNAAQQVTLLPEKTASLSYTPLDTFFAGLWWLFLVLFAVLFAQFLREDENLSWLLAVLFSLAGIEAFYGLLQVLIPSLGVIGENEIQAYAGFARGTFINRNHYAAFLNMLWPLLLAYILSLDSTAPHSEKARYAEFGHGTQPAQKRLFFGFVLALVLLALVFSASRGGILSSLIGFTVFVMLGGSAKKSILFILAGCWAIALIYGGIIGFSEILHRFDMMEQDAPSRFRIWSEAWRIAVSHPWTGTGLDSFKTVYAVYQDHLPATMHASHAHNDYLQLATELGIPAAAVLVIVIWGYWWKKVWETLRGKKQTARAEGGGPPCSRLGDSEKRQPLIAAGALAGTAAFLCHSWVEFNWQIPANALYLVTLLVLLGRGQAPRQLDGRRLTWRRP